MHKDQFARHLMSIDPVEGWWYHAAQDALEAGHFCLIGARGDQGELYLARFWLTPPVASDDGDKWDSQNSVLLHYFARGDDDQALHDHPWDFTTTVLHGSYVEHLPPRIFMLKDGVWPGDLGPAWDEQMVRRHTGATIIRRAPDLHCVGDVEPGTWTLVRTGARVRDWGFHPPGERWVPWRQYLGLEPQGAS